MKNSGRIFWNSFNRTEMWESFWNCPWVVAVGILVGILDVGIKQFDIFHFVVQLVKRGNFPQHSYKLSHSTTQYLKDLASNFKKLTLTKNSWPFLQILRLFGLTVDSEGHPWIAIPEPNCRSRLLAAKKKRITKQTNQCICHVRKAHSFQFKRLLSKQMFWANIKFQRHPLATKQRVRVGWKCELSPTWPIPWQVFATSPTDSIAIGCGQ